MDKMTMNNRPFFKVTKWKWGRNSFGWIRVPYCPHCKRRLGTLAYDKEPSECPMCHMKLDWSKKDAKI